MSKPDSWMPLYWGDYHAATGHLSALEHGAYLLLIGHYWNTRKPLPVNDDALARIAKCTAREWASIKATILEFFDASDPGCLRHGRVDRELARAVAAYDKRRQAAQETNAKRGANRNGNRDANRKEKEAPTEAVTGTQPQPQPHSSNEENSRRDADASEPEDLKGKIFGTALDWLASKSGKSKNSLRSLAGKWISAHGEEATLKAMNEAAKNSPLDPVPYIEKVFAAKPRAAELTQVDPLAKARTAARDVLEGKRYLRQTLSPSDYRQGVAAGLFTAEQAKAAGVSL